MTGSPSDRLRQGSAGTRDELIRRIEQELAQEDDQTRAERAERAAFLAQQGQPADGWGFYGSGVVVPWQELRFAFLFGLYHSALLIGQTCLENLLAGALEFTEVPVGRDTGAALLRRGVETGWLLRHEYEELDELRRQRNPYAHYRSFGDPESPSWQAVQRDLPIEEGAREPCERFIAAFYAFVNRRFGLGPVIVPAELEVIEPFIHPHQMELGED